MNKEEKNKKIEEELKEEIIEETITTKQKENTELNLEELNKQQEAKIKELFDEITKLRSENNLLKLQINELNENYKRQVVEKAQQAEKILDSKIAELKSHYKEEFNDKQKYAIEKDAAKLIEVINNFDLALKHSPEDPVVKNYVVGFKMILGMFHNLLADLNIVEITIKPGDEFDHNFMEVLEQVSNNAYKTNQVIEVLRPAYKLHDHVVCFAKVKVAK